MRDALGLKTGTRVSFVRDEAGDYFLRAKTGSIRDLAGILKWDGPPVSIEEMDEAIAEGALDSMGGS